jgi:hypothetical protein
MRVCDEFAKKDAVFREKHAGSKKLRESTSFFARSQKSSI